MLRVVNLGPDNGSWESDAECEDMMLQAMATSTSADNTLAWLTEWASSTSAYRRQVIVRFVSRRHRNEVLRARRKLKGTGISPHTRV